MKITFGQGIPDFAMNKSLNDTQFYLEDKYGCVYMYVCAFT